MKKIDLHVHSNFSDGTCTPEELVDMAVKKGLAAFALTDHDATNGVNRALSYQKETAAPVEVIPGIEISTEYHQKEIHMVGLYVDHENKKLVETTSHFVNLRSRRNHEMVENFQNAGIPMTIQDLQEGNPNTVITRAHFARYLIQHGVVKDTKEAFSQYLGEDSPFYVSRKLIPATEAITLIIEAGGVPVLAHPMHYHMEEQALRTMIKTFKEHGLVGIEVKYSNHTAQDEVFVGHLAKEFDLLPSGGSDFHGTNKPAIDLGSGRGNLSIPYDYLEQIKKYHGLK